MVSVVDVEMLELSADISGSSTVDIKNNSLHKARINNCTWSTGVVLIDNDNGKALVKPIDW